MGWTSGCLSMRRGRRSRTRHALFMRRGEGCLLGGRSVHRRSIIQLILFISGRLLRSSNWDRWCRRGRQTMLRVGVAERIIFIVITKRGSRWGRRRRSPRNVHRSPTLRRLVGRRRRRHPSRSCWRKRGSLAGPLRACRRCHFFRRCSSLINARFSSTGLQRVLEFVAGRNIRIVITVVF